MVSLAPGPQPGGFIRGTLLHRRPHQRATPQRDGLREGAPTIADEQRKGGRAALNTPTGIFAAALTFALVAFTGLTSDAPSLSESILISVTATESIPPS
jgi:hypothetical protein